MRPRLATPSVSSSPSRGPHPAPPPRPPAACTSRSADRGSVDDRTAETYSWPTAPTRGAEGRGTEAAAGGGAAEDERGGDAERADMGLAGDQAHRRRRLGRGQRWALATRRAASRRTSTTAAATAFNLPLRQ